MSFEELLAWAETHQAAPPDRLWFLPILNLIPKGNSKPDKNSQLKNLLETNGILRRGQLLMADLSKVLRLTDEMYQLLHRIVQSWDRRFELETRPAAERFDKWKRNQAFHSHYYLYSSSCVVHHSRSARHEDFCADSAAYRNGVRPKAQDTVRSNAFLRRL